MKLIQHIPTFVDGATAKSDEFNTVEELLALPWIKSWSEEPGFHRFSIVRDYPGESTLMVEKNKGRWWWVIGYIRGGDVDLPKWEAVK